MAVLEDAAGAVEVVVVLVVLALHHAHVPLGEALHYLRRELGAPRLGPETHGTQVVVQSLAIHVLGHEIRRVLTPKHLVEAESLAPELLLQPEGLGVEVANPPQSLSVGYADGRTGVGVQVGAQLVPEVLGHRDQPEGL